MAGLLARNRGGETQPYPFRTPSFDEKFASWSFENDSKNLGLVFLLLCHFFVPLFFIVSMLAESLQVLVSQFVVFVLQRSLSRSVYTSPVYGQECYYLIGSVGGMSRTKGSINGVLQSVLSRSIIVRARRHRLNQDAVERLSVGTATIFPLSCPC